MAGSDNDVFAPKHILELAANAVRQDGEGQPCVKTPYEAVALIGHACMAAVDFRLVGLGEEDRRETSSESPRLPAEWNANSTYAFRYAHSQSSMQYLVKVGRLGDKAVVFALAMGDDRTTSFDIPSKDYISESALPIASSADLATALQGLFISESRLKDLIGLFKINVIQKLAPGLQKEGYEDISQVRRERREEEQPRQEPQREGTLPALARPYPFDDPLAAPPRRPFPPGDFPPPGFEDEYEVNRPPRGWPPGNGGRGPYNIGERDLYPAGLGPNDPFRGTLGPSGGGGSGGMHPTFDDPLFGGRQGGGYDPQAPPGARYDPVGPGDQRPFGRGQGPSGRGFGGGFGGFGGGFGGGDII